MGGCGGWGGRPQQHAASRRLLRSDPAAPLPACMYWCDNLMFAWRLCGSQAEDGAGGGPAGGVGSPHSADACRTATLNVLRVSCCAPARLLQCRRPPADAPCVWSASPAAVASRISRILAALDANPTATTLAPPTTDWLKALAPGVSWAALRVAMQSSSNWVRGWGERDDCLHRCGSLSTSLAGGGVWLCMHQSCSLAANASLRALFFSAHSCFSSSSCLVTTAADRQSDPGPGAGAGRQGSEPLCAHHMRRGEG